MSAHTAAAVALGALIACSGSGNAPPTPAPAPAHARQGASLPRKGSGTFPIANPFARPDSSRRVGYGPLLSDPFPRATTSVRVTAAAAQATAVSHGLGQDRTSGRPEVTLRNVTFLGGIGLAARPRPAWVVTWPRFKGWLGGKYIPSPAGRARQLKTELNMTCVSIGVIDAQSGRALTDEGFCSPRTTW